jgi:hypothetical protein
MIYRVVWSLTVIHAPLHCPCCVPSEEQDSKYAWMIQEEIQRCADEAHRREQEDEVSCRCLLI